MAGNFVDLKILILWKGQGRFQWKVVDDAVVLYKGDEPTVKLARASAAAAFRDAHRYYGPIRLLN